MLQTFKLPALLLAFVVLARAKIYITGGDYCFPSYYGMDGPGKTFGFKHMAPNQMGVKFLLFTCNNQNTPQNFSYLSESREWKNSNLNVNKTTRFIVHGWKGAYPANVAGYKWMEQMKNLVLKKSCDNVIVVDWSVPAKSNYYYESAENTRVIGKMIACVINRLKTELGLSPNKVHLIGHSLGGEVVAFAGKEVTNPKVKQITGLDPAGPAFQELTDSNKLNVTDGQCVNVIHTNGARTLPIIDGLGNLAPMGNFDFYPNGGHEQPGCGKFDGTHHLLKDLINPKAAIKDIAGDVLCNHVRSVMYGITDQNYTDNQKCQVIGHTCSSYQDFNAGKCGACGKDGKGCKPMPLNLDYWDDPKNCDSNANRVQYYLNTGNAEDHQGYCLHHYQIIVSVNDNLIPCFGQIPIRLSNGKQIDVSLNHNNLLEISKGNKVFTKLYTNSQELGTFSGASIILPDIICPVNKIEFKYMSSMDASVRKSKSMALCSSNRRTFNKC